ncbi:MAG: cytochrome c family protein [Alphaproteobacteria bacterium]|nr:cytochrome c family protein [Alphaproteobacteria bacterium]
MSSFEFNKIFAAVLVAGIVAMLGGFVAELLMHPHELEKNAVEIDGGPVASGGGAAEAMPEPILSLIADADIAKGEKLSKACAACHSFESGGPAKVGPNLYGVVGRAKGSKAGFEYSAGMKAVGGSWTYADLNKFLWKPKKFVADTKMNYIGLKKPEDRAAMIAWLRTLGSSAALPTQGQIDAEMAELATPEAEEPASEGAPSEEAPSAH